jgi:hypothetical protein
MALYRVGAAAKLAELDAGMGSDSAREIYRQVASDLLRAYPERSASNS